MVHARNKGCAYERELAEDYRAFFPECLTSRNSNIQMDWKGVDLTGTPGFNIQSKCYGSFPVAKAIKVLKKEMPKDENKNILHIKISNKGEVVVMDKETWYKILYDLQQRGGN